ncbi:Protein terminal ear1 [Trichinella spiralis]|uniref:Protein terminal ear1 n=1 Tax=Trichinella spiralis TaxID=6334 RepID=A0ABR3KMT9_TRISP
MYLSADNFDRRNDDHFLTIQMTDNDDDDNTLVIVVAGRNAVHRSVFSSFDDLSSVEQSAQRWRFQANLHN